MDDKPTESRATIADIVPGLLFTAGFMTLLEALPFAAILAAPTIRDGWKWTWTLALGAAIMAVFVVFGFFLIYLAQIICWYQWGEWPAVFWSWRKKSGDGN